MGGEGGGIEFFANDLSMIYRLTTLDERFILKRWELLYAEENMLEPWNDH